MGCWLGLESGAVPSGESGGLARLKSFFQKTLEARRGVFWLKPGRAGPRPATDGPGCGTGGQQGAAGRGLAGALWRDLGGTPGGSHRYGNRRSRGSDEAEGVCRASGIGWG